MAQRAHTSTEGRARVGAASVYTTTSGCDTPQETAVTTDIVADRHSLVLIGLTSVSLACVVFAIMRWIVTLQTGKLTPWWGNAAGAAAVLAIYGWYRRSPAARSSATAHLTALVAVLALLVPIAYGMTSTVWWLSLVGFAMVLLGRRFEAIVWGVGIPLLVIASVLAEPFVQVAGGAGESPVEAALAKVVFVVILLGMAAAFRRVALQRATALHDSQERYRMLFQRVPVGVFHCDRDLRITDCNRQFALILGDAQGDTHERFIGFDLSSLHDQRFLPAVRAALAGAPGAYDGPYARPDARGEVSLSVRAVPLHGRDALITGTLGLVEDVTDRVRMEAELRERKREFEARALSGEDLAAKRLQRLDHLNKVLRAVRNVNQLIVKEKDAARLIQQACEILVETRGYGGAWISTSAESGKLEAVAGAGWGDRLAAFAQELRRGASPACWAKARAAQDGIAVLGPDAGCGACSLRETLEGGRTIVATLVHDDKHLGFLGISTPPGLTVDDEERSLVAEVAGDLAFALHKIGEGKRHLEIEERFRVSFERTSVGKALTSCDGRLLRVNDALASMLGYRRDELEGRSFSDFTHPDDIASSVESARALVAGAATQRFEKRYLRKDGSVVWADANIAAVRDANGAAQYFIAGLIDVTERRRSEEALRQSEERFRVLFEQAADNILLLEITPEGVPVIRDANRATFANLGYGWDALIGQPLSFLDAPSESDEPDGEVEERGRRLLSGAGTTFETTHRCKDGSLREFECSAVGVQIGAKTFAMSVERDITERKDLEERLRASQKMEAIGSLAGGVAHDFNNLLSVILSYTSFAMDALADGEPVKNDLVEVKNAADRAAALTRQLLAFGRKQILQPVALDLNRTAAGLENMLRRLLGEDINFVQRLAPDLGLTLADPGQIEQVIMNLVVNARDAMPDGGELTIATANVDVDEAFAASHVGAKPGRYVQLKVTDTGCGMDEATRARIFEPFFTTKEQGKGTGLGLSTVYGIVKQSGGYITADSDPGQGTTFSIVLPQDLVATEAAVIRAPAEPGQSTGTEVILVVEDAAPLRRLARRTLEGAGYTVLTAANAEDALLCSAQHPGTIDLLLTDVVMPGISGGALAQELALARPALKVIFMSGYTDDAIVRHGVLDAGKHFLGKPFASTDLTRKVREVLDLSAHLGSAAPR